MIPLSDKMIAVEDLKRILTIDEGEALRQEGIALLQEEVVLRIFLHIRKRTSSSLARSDDETNRSFGSIYLYWTFRSSV